MKKEPNQSLRPTPASARGCSQRWPNKMIRRGLILSLVLTTISLAQPESRAPAPRPRLTEERRLSMSPHPPAAKKESASDGERAIIMTPVTVTERRSVSAPKEELPKSQPFTLRDGGTFLKREGPKVITEVKFQFNGQGWDILSFSW
jgi:hypothetical protein